MTIAFFLRPPKSSDAAAAADFGGHFVEDPDKSSIFKFKLGPQGRELSSRSFSIPTDALPVKDDLEAPEDVQANLAKFDQETQELIFAQARQNLLSQELGLLDLETKLLLLTQEVRRVIQEFEDEMLLVLLDC